MLFGKNLVFIEKGAGKIDFRTFFYNMINIKECSIKQYLEPS
jgi:hypothetical protein